MIRIFFIYNIKFIVFISFSVLVISNYVLGYFLFHWLKAFKFVSKNYFEINEWYFINWYKMLNFPRCLWHCLWVQLAIELWVIGLILSHLPIFSLHLSLNWKIILPILTTTKVLCYSTIISWMENSYRHQRLPVLIRKTFWQN